MDLRDPAPRRVLAALSAINPAIGEAVRARWSAHVSENEPLVVFFGPHNAGKTSLLQRLLVDDGSAAPPWVRVGARPEESSGEVLEWRGWRILDLPGIGSEQEQHDALAWESIELADAVVLVMSLKLLTGEGLEIKSVLDGSWWTGSDEVLQWPHGALHVVIGRIDAGQADPDEDPAELDDLKDELVPELDKLLAQAHPRPPVSWVAASPAGILRGGHAPEATLADSRRWDGVAGFEERLEEAAADVDGLRAGALVRYLHRTAHAIDDELAAELTRLETLSESARAMEARAVSLDAQVDAAQVATEAKVRAVVLECFSAVVDAEAAAPEQTMRDELARRAPQVDQEFRRDFDALVESMQRMLDASLEVPLAERSRQKAPPPKQKAKESGRPVPWGKASTTLRNLVKEGVEIKLDDSITATRRRLKTLESKEGEALVKALEKAGFGSQKDADAARDLLGKYDAATKALGAVPDIVELARFFGDLKRGRDARLKAKDLQKRQEELVAKLADELLEGPRGFRAQIERVRLAAHESLPTFDDSSDLSEAARELASWREELHAALGQLRAGRD